MTARPPQQDLAGPDRIIFDRARDFLIASLGEVEFARPEESPEGENTARQALIYIEADEHREAYELMYSVVAENNLSDILFLGLALTNYHLDYLEAAGKYAAIASTLHDLRGAGPQSELLKSYSTALGRMVEEWKNDKIIVNQRFVNLYPTQDQIEQNNAVDKYVMEGLTPAQPFVTKADRIVTIGSCFTGNVSTFLRHNGFDVPILNTAYEGNLSTGSFSDEVFNTYILRYFFELAFGDEVAEDDAYEVVNQHNLKTTFSVAHMKETFNSANVFIITLGLSEVWFNKLTGAVYKTAKSVGEFDPELHDFRVTTVSENFENIKYVYQSIRRNREDAAIIFTLSPVPLKATFRDMACIPANAVSKAILRVALDELFNEFGEDQRLHYFPSYELILDCLPHPFGPDRRYISNDVINFVMTLFANHYVVHQKQPLENHHQP